MSKDLNRITEGWPPESGAVVARTFIADDGNTFIQLRLDLGLLQMALDGRPDGEHPDGCDTTLDAVLRQCDGRSGPPLVTDEQRSALAREMLQYYRRRISLMALAKDAQERDEGELADAFFRRAIRDANHNLAILDLLRSCGAEVDLSEHEQYRPFILMHRAACRAERALLAQDPDGAIDQLKAGIAAIRACGAEYEESGEDEIPDVRPFMRELRQFEKHIRKRYRRRRTLREQLADAVAAEDFERAAMLRDALAARRHQRGDSLRE